MYRGFIKEIYNLTGNSIGNSELRILSSNIKRDILTKASSSFQVLNVPEEAKNGHIFGCYDDYGKIRYLGVISNIDGTVIQTDQIISIFDDNWLWNNPKETTIEQTIKTILETDFQNNHDTMVSTIFSQFDIIIESSGTQLVLGSQDSQYVKNFMNLIFDIYEKYQIIIDINIYYKNQRPQIIIRKPEFETIKIIDNNYAINNINVMKETYETNKLIVYSSEGEHRGTWYGTVNGITDDDDYTNRLPKIKTNIAFSDDDISIIKAQNLRNQMYNHKIEVQLLMNNKLYNFEEFNLGQTFHIYHKKDMYESILTGYEIGMDQNGYSDVVTLVFGIVRVSLVDKLNKLTDAARSITQNYTGGGGGGSLETVYPVGSIYMSVNDTNPYDLFGFGTWEQIKDTFLLGAGDIYTAGTTGGEATHVLTVDEMPSHNHNYGQYKGYAGWQGDSPQNNFMKNTGNDGYSTTNNNGYMTTLNKGGGQAHNNMPPYLTIYIWKRVS